MDASLRNKCVTVMGLGRFGGGVGVTRWLCGQGAIVTVSDQAGAADLANSVKALDGLDVTFHLGGHDLADFTGCELLVANPAVPFDSPHLAAARSAGVQITTEINLFVSRCPAAIIGITGSAGKSTTTSMIGAMLAGWRPTHVGGNIGKSLLLELESIRPDHLVVLELSSFQLAYFPELHKSPHVAVVTNLQPNHLDRHAGMDDYASAKKNIFRYQGPGDVLVLNRADPLVSKWAAEAKGKVDFFDLSGPPFEINLPGEHNQLNAQAAWAAVRQLGLPREIAAAALAKFEGLKHRIQFVAERAGVKFYNDSKSTCPAECHVALMSFPPRKTVVIVGGYDKKIDLTDLCRDLAERARAVVCTGQTGRQIADGVLAQRKGDLPAVTHEADFAAAVAAACRAAQPGEAVLLSPACASYDQFKNYEERGELFVDLVRVPRS